MKNKKLLARARTYAESTTWPFEVVYTEDPTELTDADWGFRYFFEYTQRRVTANRFKTQQELSDFLEERGF